MPRVADKPAPRRGFCLLCAAHRPFKRLLCRRAFRPELFAKFANTQ
jgi:hypothetical protein